MAQSGVGGRKRAGSGAGAQLANIRAIRIFPANQDTAHQKENAWLPGTNPPAPRNVSCGRKPINFKKGNHMNRIDRFRSALLVGAALFASVCSAQFQGWPADVASQRLEQWVAAFNSGDRAQIESSSTNTMYRGTHNTIKPGNMVDTFVGIREKTGPVTVSSVEVDGAVITVNAVAADTGNDLKIVATVSDADPGFFKSISIRREHRQKISGN
jgi:hypothetical protein